MRDKLLNQELFRPFINYLFLPMERALSQVRVIRKYHYGIFIAMRGLEYLKEALKVYFCPTERDLYHGVVVKK